MVCNIKIVSGQLTSCIAEIFEHNNFERFNVYAVQHQVFFYPIPNNERYYVGIINEHNDIIALGMYGRSVWEFCNIWVTALCSTVKGCGSLILCEIEKNVKMIFPMEILYIEADNKALGFYEKFGYQTVPDQKYDEKCTNYTLIYKSFDINPFIYKSFAINPLL